MSAVVEERDFIDDTVSIVDAVAAQGKVARAFGGIAVRLRCQSAERVQGLRRGYGDVDLVVTRDSVGALHGAAESVGYQPEAEFNAAHGRRRLLFLGPRGEHLDVFVETFAMCHELELGDRLELNARTISLADLVLTKAQVAELNMKDVVDLGALFADHELTEDESGINLPYLTGFLSRDWSWWRSATESLATARRVLGEQDLPASTAAAIDRRIRNLQDAIEARPKGRRWRMRARIGERLPWRDEPEEIE